MTGTEMNGLVDKLADKLDVAVDKVLPVAQEALEQFVVRETSLAIVSGALAVVGLVALFFCGALVYKSATKLGDCKCCEEPPYVAGCIGGGLGSIFALVLLCAQTHCAVYHAAKAMAPLAALVGI